MGQPGKPGLWVTVEGVIPALLMSRSGAQGDGAGRAMRSRCGIRLVHAARPVFAVFAGGRPAGRERGSCSHFSFLRGTS